MKFAPSTSDNRPCTERRHRSIWKSRSPAWTKPCAKNTSSTVAAVICGTPDRSRTIVTGAERPSTRTRPDTGGSGEPMAGSGSRGAVHAAADAALASTQAASHRATIAPPRLLHYGAQERCVLKDGLLAEYDHEVATTRKLIERLPED